MASPVLDRKPAPAPAAAQARPPSAASAVSVPSSGGLAAAVKRQADAAGPRVSLGLAGPSAEEVSLKGTGTFAPPQPVADYLATNPSGGGEVSVRLPGVAAGVIRVRRHGAKYSTPSEVQAIDLVHPALQPLRSVGLTPLLVVEISASTITGYVTVSTGKRPLASRHAVIDKLQDHAAAVGFVGMGNLRLQKPVNQLQGGTLTLSTDLAFQLGGFLNGTGSFGLTDDVITFAAHAHASVKGIAEVSLDLERGADGAIAGRAEIPVNLKNFSGSVVVTLAGGAVDAIGTIRYATEKLTGEVTLVVTDAQTARTVAYQHLPPEAIDASAREAAGASAGAAAAKTPKPGPRALAGWGTLEARFSDWLTGRAVVIVDGEGHVTVIGKITPQAKVEFAQTRVASRVRLLTLEARATYGIPVVGDVFVFFSLSLDSVVNVTPLTLSKIEVDGTYSTDPKIFNSFSLSANLNISAMAALELDARAGAGLEIAEHDIKIGAGLTATAGVKSYLDATPILGYRELADAAAGRRGEFYIHGDVELAAQAFLALAGYLFVALETPWWSPISDHTWKWPIGELEYILPGQFGFGAEIDYIFGSGKLPSISLKGVDFNPERFAGDLMDDSVPKGTPGPQEKRGAWKEKLTAPPAPPPAPPKVLDSKGKRARKDGKAVKTEGAAFADGVKAIDALRKRADATPMPAAELVAELEAIRKRCGLTDLHTKAGTGILEVTAGRGKLKLPKPVRIKVGPGAVKLPAGGAGGQVPVLPRAAGPPMRLPELHIDDRLTLADGRHELMTEADPLRLVLRSAPIDLSTVTGGNLPSRYQTYVTAVRQYQSMVAIYDDPQRSLALGGTTGQAPKGARLGKEAVNRAVDAIADWVSTNGVPPTDAPGLGVVLPYAGQHTRFQQIRIWTLEAEHVIPNGYFNALLDAMGLGRIGTSGENGEYAQMSTILIYERAAEWKTSGRGGNEGDLRIMQRIETWARRYFRELRRDGGQGANFDESVQHLMSGFEREIGDVVARTLAAIDAEQLINGPLRGHPRGALMRDFFTPLVREVKERQLALFGVVLEKRLEQAVHARRRPGP